MIKFRISLLLLILTLSLLMISDCESEGEDVMWSAEDLTSAAALFYRRYTEDDATEWAICSLDDSEEMLSDAEILPCTGENAPIIASTRPKMTKTP